MWGKASSGTWNAALEVKAEDGDKTLKACTAAASRCVELGLHAAYSDFDGERRRQHCFATAPFQPFFVCADHFEDAARNPFNPDVSRAIARL